MNEEAKVYHERYVSAVDKAVTEAASAGAFGEKMLALYAFVVVGLALFVLYLPTLKEYANGR